MHSMVKRHSVKVLREAGHSQRDVGERLGICERSVREIEDEPVIQSLDDAAERARRAIGRPSKVEPWREKVTELLKAEPSMQGLEVLRRIRLDGYGGAKSALYELVKELRPKEVRPVIRFEGVAGEFCQHDFGHVDVRFIDGPVKRVHFFASRLKYSRMVAVTLVEDERVESLVRALVPHYEAFGGVPLLSVFDRPKTVAVEWKKDGTVTKWNSTFLSVVAELGVGVELCWPYQPRQKGSVENLVGWVKGSFFKQRRFLDDADVRAQLAEWHREVNEQRPSRATGEVPLTRWKRDEQQRLRPLRVKSAELMLRFPVHVGPTGMVTHETRRYSMPPETMGLSGTMYLGSDTVRLVVGRHDVMHPRQQERNAVSILPEHRAAALAATSGQRGRNYLKREHLFALGPAVVDYLTEVVHRRPKLWNRDVNILHELLSLHGDEALRTAITLAGEQRTYGYEYVARQLRDARAAAMNFDAEEVAQ
jgi:transposase